MRSIIWLSPDGPKPIEAIMEPKGAYFVGGIAPFPYDPEAHEEREAAWDAIGGQIRQLLESDLERAKLATGVELRADSPIEIMEFSDSTTGGDLLMLWRIRVAHVRH